MNLIFKNFVTDTNIIIIFKFLSIHVFYLSFEIHKIPFL